MQVSSAASRRAIFDAGEIEVSRRNGARRIPDGALLAVREFVLEFDGSLFLDHEIIVNETPLGRILGWYLDYCHASRTHLSLAKDSPERRSIQPPDMERIVAIPQVGGLHHRDERWPA